MCLRSHQSLLSPQHPPLPPSSAPSAAALCPTLFITQPNKQLPPSSCTALEQERSSLASQLKASATALADGEAARRALVQQLREAGAERDEAVRLNLGLQVRVCVRHTVAYVSSNRVCRSLVVAVA